MKTKTSFLSKVLSTAMATAMLVWPCGVTAGNLPTGAHVVSGSVTIDTNGKTMNIAQGSDKAIINWDSFSIGKGYAVDINQISSQAAMLARVTGASLSEIYGSLTANGTFYLVNPNGIVFGSGAVIDVNKFIASTLDIANALDVPRVRIQGEPLVMYEGKSYLAIEVNKKRTEDLPWDAKYLTGHRIPLGLDNYRNTIVWDLDNNTTPHVLVCGATGSGKSVCLTNILYYAIESGVKDITILDPKFEFAFAELPDNVHVLSDISEIERSLAAMVADMNNRVKNRQKWLSLVIFDEFADAADQSRGQKELNDGEKTLIDNFKMLLQKGRSAGFRFVAATQRASVKTIPGDIKVNLPVQVCFRVPKGLDSKVVLDTEGAETLAGAGDGLIHSPEYNDGLVRFQAFYRPL